MQCISFSTAISTCHYCNVSYIVTSTVLSYLTQSHEQLYRGEIFQNYMANLTICVWEQSNFAASQPSCSSEIPSSAEVIFAGGLAATSVGATARKLTCPLAVQPICELCCS